MPPQPPAATALGKYDSLQAVRVLRVRVVVVVPPAAWKAVKPFFNGGLSGMMATCIIQPIDMVKVRLQLGAKGSPAEVCNLERVAQQPPRNLRHGCRRRPRLSHPGGVKGRDGPHPLEQDVGAGEVAVYDSTAVQVLEAAEHVACGQ
ncbi:putative mitochondrial 2-oxoglutarate/malate carrier protein [Tetrabaena socialis]|uniref:Putative mitochondrial 2-oxoglutarate/malate carrier protein n=1 Tax=Tetrabaena socialis TaxID=47790 RepID=A0A2J7ZS10_9CHLO|nr:putative mitochondrial 2-oxoglutarate/malate carrier protein [Tetrabaena socialis]|eukprot:PNH03059.1 putative mitochondrial 2-oxoglutarate/malate carrier protein [Tetrabaena socialis]